jgi:hypothetical protein
MTSGKGDKPSLWELYQVEDFIDARDNQGDWRVGYIVGKYDNLKSFKVRFDGWSSKYDEVRIRTFRASGTTASSLGLLGVRSSDTPDKFRTRL